MMLNLQNTIQILKLFRKFVNNNNLYHPIMKRLLLLLPLFLIACKNNKSYISEELIITKDNDVHTIEGSQFFDELNNGDTLKIINYRHYCELGPFEETYKIFHESPNETLRCEYRMEKGWRTMKKGTAMVIGFGISDKVVQSYLIFENDVINKKTGKDDESCTFYEYFDIVLNNDTISSAHSDCSYEGFENFRDALKEEVIYVESWSHHFIAPSFY